jgi:hypothetical protein
MKQQTAVEWLEQKFNDPYNNRPFITKEEFEQAKAMEKEQIINTWSEATAPDHEIGLSDAFYIISQVQKAEQYYNETYGGDK